MPKHCPKDGFKVNWYLVPVVYSWAARDAASGCWYVYSAEPSINFLGSWNPTSRAQSWSNLARYQWMPMRGYIRPISIEQARGSLQRRPS